MSSLNKCIFIGRLGRDPELKYTQNGTAVCNFSIAVDEEYKDRDGNKKKDTQWIPLVTWQRLAENCGNYLRKGSLVFVEGNLQTRQWQDKDGNTRYTTEVKAQRVQFLDSRGQGQQPQSQSQGQGRQQSQQPGPGYDEDLGPAFPSQAGGMDNIPF